MNLRTHFSNGFSTNETADLTCVCYKLGLPPVLAITHYTLKTRDMKKQARVSVAQASLELEI